MKKTEKFLIIIKRSKDMMLFSKIIALSNILAENVEISVIWRIFMI